MRRLLAIVLAAGTASGLGGVAHASCTTYVAAGTRVGYCAGFVCQDYCEWQNPTIVCEPAAKVAVTPCGLVH